MAIVKLCLTCKKWFPSSVGSWVNYCPVCLTKKVRARMIERIKHQRAITFDWFGVWDTHRPLKNTKKFPNGNYERVCQQCGKRLISKKTKKYHGSMRFCGKPCTGTKLWNRFNWSAARKRKMKQNYRPKNRGHHCEICNKISPYGLYSDNSITFPVHHRIPVHTLGWHNILLIWELSNLMVLCTLCHNKQDHRLKKSQKPGKRHQFKDLTGYLEKGEFVK